MNIGKITTFLYVMAGIFFFVFWVLVLFPTEAVKSRVINQIENQTQGRYKVDIKDLSLTMFGNLKLKEVKVTEVAGTDQKPLFESPKVKLIVSYLSLLSNHIKSDFYIKGTKGEVEGSVSQEGDEFLLDLDFDEYSLADVGWFAAEAKVPLKGKLDGEFNVRVNRMDYTQDTGKINLKFINLATASTSVSLDPSTPEATVTLPPIKLTGEKGSVLIGEVKKGNLEISSFTLSGGDIKLDLKGRVLLQAKDLADYRLNLQGFFQIADPIMKALPIAFLLESQKTPNGDYPLQIGGRLGKPTIRIGTFNLPI
jgi:type II secretion system protein N